jgi:hypothetical protein
MKVCWPSRTLLLPLLLVLPLTGCVLHSHRVSTELAGAKLETATQEQLVERINSQACGIHTLNATVDIDTSVGGTKKGEVTDYQEIRGYILVRQPAMLRMIGLMPVIRNHAFDMVSNGQEFQLWIPTKNKFYVGRNNTVAPGSTGLMALRPQIIYDSLLLHCIDPKDEVAVLESGSTLVVDPKTHHKIEQPDYRLDIIQQDGQVWRLTRKLYFSRVDLQPRRQTIFDRGRITTENRYDNWKQYGNLWFPSVTEIARPEEEYEITLGIVKLTLNEPLTDQQFSLPLPPGAEVVQLNDASSLPSHGTR